MIIIESIQDYIQISAKYSHGCVVSKKTGQQINVPCMSVFMVCRDLIVANQYNPNSVPYDKMQLLKESILSNGFCFPIVTILDKELGKFVIIDGFHRFLISGPKYLDFEHIPVVVLPHDSTQRMLATIQFNKARGSHQVDLDADVIRRLIQQGLTEQEISDKLKIELETVHRYKQVCGVAEIFSKMNYSIGWEMQNIDDNKSETE